MPVCAIKISEKGRNSLGVSLLLLNLSIAMMGFITIIMGIILAFLFHQQKDLLKEYGYKKLTNFIIFSGMSLLILHLLGAKACYDCGNYQTRQQFKNFLLIYIGLLFVALGLLLILSISTSNAIHDLSKGFEKGFTELMDSYDADKNKRLQVDLIQVKNKCCGSKGFKDWTGISWHAEEYLRRELQRSKSRGVPFTCCNSQYAGPCVHDVVGIARPGYKINSGESFYQKGCAEVITITLRWLLKQMSLWLILPIWLEIFTIIMTKYLHTSIQTAKDEKGPGYGYIMEKCPCTCLKFMECDIHAMQKEKVIHDSD